METSGRLQSLHLRVNARLRGECAYGTADYASIIVGEVCMVSVGGKERGNWGAKHNFALYGRTEEHERGAR